MKLEDIIIGKEYWLKKDAPYVFAKNKDLILINSYLTNVKVLQASEDIHTSKGFCYNLEVSVQGYFCEYRYYINSYYLEEIKNNKFDTSPWDTINMNCNLTNKQDISEALDCIEIHKGKAIFNKKEKTKEEMSQEFNLHFWYEHNLINKEINNENDWDKELILMNSDLALDKKDKTEFKLLSKKLREIKER